MNGEGVQINMKGVNMKGEGVNLMGEVTGLHSRVGGGGWLDPPGFRGFLLWTIPMPVRYKMRVQKLCQKRTALCCG